MFSKIFRRTKIGKMPSGYPLYAAKDFEERFAISVEQSKMLERDYLFLLQTDGKSDFRLQVFNAGRDLHSLSKFIDARYGVNESQAPALALFFANIATARNAQVRRKSLGISKCVWMTSTCGGLDNDPNASHIAFSDQAFDSEKGLLTESGYLLPGVAIGCTCGSKSIIPGISG